MIDVDILLLLDCKKIFMAIKSVLYHMYRNLVKPKVLPMATSSNYFNLGRNYDA
jgi:hypothetical protein